MNIATKAEIVRQLKITNAMANRLCEPLTPIKKHYNYAYYDMSQVEQAYKNWQALPKKPPAGHLPLTHFRSLLKVNADTLRKLSQERTFPKPDGYYHLETNGKRVAHYNVKTVIKWFDGDSDADIAQPSSRPANAWPVPDVIQNPHSQQINFMTAVFNQTRQQRLNHVNDAAR